jgi:hypothetical protein
LTLQEGRQGSSLEVTDELRERLNGEGLKASTESVLLHVVCGVKDAEGGEVGLLNTDEFTKSLLNAVSNSGLNEEDFTLKGLGSLRESSVESLIGVSVRSEQEDGGLSLAEDGLDVVLREVNQSGDRASLEPVDDGGAFPVATVDNGVLIELAEDNEAWGVNCTERGCALLVVDVEELILLSDSGVLGNIEEDLSVLSADGLTEVGNGELGLFDLLLELSAGNLVGGRANLLEDPVDNFVFSAATSVLNLLSLPI